MKKKEAQQVFREFVDEKTIIGASLLKIDGTVLAAHYAGIQDTIPTLIARESLGAKRRRRSVFPVLGKLITSVAKYEKMYVGLSLLSKDKYVELIGNPEVPLTRFAKKLREISDKLSSSQ